MDKKWNEKKRKISFLANTYIKWIVSVFQGLCIKYANTAD